MHWKLLFISLCVLLLLVHLGIPPNRDHAVALKQQNSKDAQSVVPVKSEPKSQARCSNGVDTVAKKDEYWSFNQRIYPGLADAFFKNDSLVLIFNIKPLWCSTCSSNDWSKATWGCKLEFSEHSVRATEVNIYMDPHNHTLIATCRSPQLQKRILENKLDLGQAYKASISAFLSHELHFQYSDVPFCLYPTLDGWIKNHNMKNDVQLEVKPIDLAACTQVRADYKNSFKDTVEWILYHLNQGFRHFYIYPDGESEQWRCLLKPLIDSGVVEIIEWLWPETDETYGASSKLGQPPHQQTQQNSCLYRHRGTTTWLGLHDVDEFFQPMSYNLMDTIAQFPLDIGAIQARSIYFGSSDEGLEKESKLNSGRTDDIRLVTETYVHRDVEAIKRGREKCLARPENVFTFSTHMVTSGKEMIVPDPDILRVAHYKPNLKLPILDETMRSYSSGIKSTLKKFYPDGLPTC